MCGSLKWGKEKLSFANKQNIIFRLTTKIYLTYYYKNKANSYNYKMCMEQNNTTQNTAQKIQHETHTEQERKTNNRDLLNSIWHHKRTIHKQKHKKVKPNIKSLLRQKCKTFSFIREAGQVCSNHAVEMQTGRYKRTWQARNVSDIIRPHGAFRSRPQCMHQSTKLCHYFFLFI